MKVIVKKKGPAGAETPTSNHKNGIVIIIAENRQECKTQIKVTHWMPIPALPKEAIGL